MTLEKLSTGINVDIAYLDFSKAFDLVDFSILLLKMKKIGIRGNLLRWTLNFLSNRTQNVRINQTLSRSAPLHSGVPQGSVMGPLLFLIFIGDIDGKVSSNNMKILKYVDDSKLIIDINKEEDVFFA